MKANVNIASYGAPTLWVTIDDMRIPVAVPTLNVAEQLLSKANLLAEAKDGLTQETYDLAFEMLATMLSVNHNFMKYTADELKQKNITVTQIIGIMADWVGFIGDVANSKN